MSKSLGQKVIVQKITVQKIGRKTNQRTNQKPGQKRDQNEDQKDQKPDPKTDRKLKIIHAAIKCFIKNGVAQTRMAEVAERAGVDQPLIHYYFSTSDSLYTEVVRVLLEDLRAEVVLRMANGQGQSSQAICNYIRAHFEWAQKNPGYFSLSMYFYYLSTFNPAFYSLNLLIRETGRERISSVIYRGIEDGDIHLPKGVSVAAAALSIQGLITGNVIMAATEGDADWSQFCDSAVQFTQNLCQMKKAEMHPAH